jgi:hypothetical protein
MYPLVHAAQVANPDVRQNETDQCLPGSLSPEKAKGKIVLCFRGAGTRVGKGVEVKRAGGAGFILANSKANGEELSVDSHLLPANAVGYTNGLKILNYINSAKNPVAYIAPAETILGVRAPYMTAFSSRGPNVIYPDVIKVIMRFLMFRMPKHKIHVMFLDYCNEIPCFLAARYYSSRTERTGSLE